MNYINVKQLNEDILNNISKIPRDIDLVVGIPRSGMIVASLISVYINKPLSDIDSFINGKIYSSGNTKNTSDFINSISEVKKVLIIDDSIASGKSINIAKERLSKIKDIEMIFLVPYIVPDAVKKCDIYFKVVDLPRRFEWNLFHHSDLKNACVDLDGVLCIDPTEKENDDGINYINFIKNAKVKYIPSRKIGYIVTSRLEKYRKLTEEWLKNNNIEYGKLIMMNLETAEERQKLSNHGSYKGKIYKKLKDADLFIESEYSQALEISKISKKSVICVNNNYIINNKEKISSKIKRKTKDYLKRILTKEQIKKLKKIRK